jgi:hypothetical protein
MTAPESEELRTWPGLDSEFFALEAGLVERGLIRHPSEPLLDWLERAAASPALADLRASLGDLLGLHYRHRFDPRGLTQNEREALRQKAMLCLRQINELHSLSQPPVEQEKTVL